MNKSLDYMIASILDTPMKREGFFHALMISIGEISIDPEGNRILKQNLMNDSTLENIFYGHSLITVPLFIYFQSLSGQMRAKIEKVAEVLYGVSFNFKTIKATDPNFPDSLKAIDGFPPVLYLRGDESLLGTKSFTVVGTRKLEEMDYSYVREGKYAVRDLVLDGFTIISGLARGCDTLAHHTAITNKGRTIAVLGTPLNRHYPNPNENEHLQDKIARKHLLVSQYPIGIETQPLHFANRNMTMVGLSSEGILVIAAGDNSGTQHAIRACINQGKTLYALPRNLEEGYQWVKNPKVHSFDKYYEERKNER